jgi:uncharacterized membrane protein YphA (DoxX/SURF4 family)
MNFFRQELLKKYSPIILRIGISLVLLWFGISQVTNASAWIGWLPSFTSSWPISQTALVFLNGSFEIILGLMLILGLYTRVAAALIALHLLGITLSVGYNEIGIRDFGLFMAALAIALNGDDDWCLDKSFHKK